MNYNKFSLDLYYKENHSDSFKKIFSKMHGPFPRFRIERDALFIKGYKISNVESFSDDLENILNCIFYETYFIFGLIFESIPYTSITTPRYRKTRRKPIDVNKYPIELTYKKYNPELLEYIKSAESVIYLPFRFLSFFQVIEYHCDRSTYKSFSRELKEIMMKPDFHINVEKYIPKAVQLFRKKAPNISKERAKILNVIKEFISIDDFNETFADLNVLDGSISFSNGLKIPAINMDSESKFFNTLTDRIYKLRNAIVHSNPDYDEEKAKPLIPNTDDLYKLEYELQLIKYIADNIVQKTSI